MQTEASKTDDNALAGGVEISLPKSAPLQGFADPYSEYLRHDYCFSCAYFKSTKGHFGICSDMGSKVPYDGTKQDSACAGWRIKSAWADAQFKLQEEPFPKRTQFTVKGARDRRTGQWKDELGSVMSRKEEEVISSLYQSLNLAKVEIHRRQREEQWAKEERAEARGRLRALRDAEKEERAELRLRSLAERQEERERYWALRNDPIERAKRYIAIWSGKRIIGPASIVGYFLESAGLDFPSQTWSISQLILQSHMTGMSMQEIQGWFLSGVGGPSIDLPDEAVLGCVKDFHLFCQKVGVPCETAILAVGVYETEEERRRRLYIEERRVRESTVRQKHAKYEPLPYVPFATFWKGIYEEYPYGMRKEEKPVTIHYDTSMLSKAKTFWKRIEQPASLKRPALGKRDMKAISMARKWIAEGSPIEETERGMVLLYGSKQAERVAPIWRAEIPTIPVLKIERRRH